MNLRVGLVLAGLIGFLANAEAEDAKTDAKPTVKLMVGDKAPKLQVGKWLQGDPVKELSRGHAYIIEFWATWCAPCRKSIPELNEFQKKFKDKGLVVIGVDVMEDDEADAPKFIKEMGDKMTYRLVTDDTKDSENGKMADTWKDATGVTGIPLAIVVAKSGEIAWIGSPLSLKEKLLEDVLAGTYDIKRAAIEYKKQREMQEKYDAAFEEFQKASTAKDWDKAEALLQQMNESAPDEDSRTDADLARFRMNLIRGDLAKVETVAKTLAEKQPENSEFHSVIAWQLATYKEPSQSLLDLAEKEAKRANEIAKGKDADVLDTLARVQFVRGDKESAVATQQKAVDTAEDAKDKANYKKTLDSYKAGKIPEA
jgi:thiol-disulfide isomerase/thioredoxin